MLTRSVLSVLFVCVCVRVRVCFPSGVGGWSPCKDDVVLLDFGLSVQEEG